MHNTGYKLYIYISIYTYIDFVIYQNYINLFGRPLLFRQRVVFDISKIFPQPPRPVSCQKLSQPLLPYEALHPSKVNYIKRCPSSATETH